MNKIILLFLMLLLILPSAFLLGSAGRLGGIPMGEILSLVQETIAPTLLVCFLSAFLATILGFLAGFLLAKSALPWRSVFLGLVFLGMAIPCHIHTAQALLFFGRAGILTPFLQKIFPAFSIYGLAGVVALHAVCFSALSTLLCWGAFMCNNAHLEEQTRLYLNPSQHMVWVVLPQAAWGAMTSFIVVFILVAGEMTVTDLLGVDTAARKIYLFLSLYYRPEMATLLTIPLILLTALACLLLYFILRRRGILLGEDFAKRQESTGPVSGIKSAMFLLLLILCMPYLISLASLVLETGGSQYLAQTYRATAKEFWYSIYVSAWSAFMLASVAMPLAWFMNRAFRFSFVLLALLVWCSLLPPSLTALGIMKIFAKGADLPFVGSAFLYLRDTDAILVLGYFLRYLPYAVFVCLLGLRSIPAVCEEIASLQGCNVYQQFFFVVLPLGKRTFALAFLLSFLFCLGDLQLSILIIAPGTTTLTIRIFTLLHYGVRADVVCVCVFLLVIVIATISIAWLILSSPAGKKRARGR